MKSLILSLCVFIIALNGTLARCDEVTYSDSPDGMCLKMKVGAPVLFHNLAQFKCMSKVAFPDSTAAAIIKSEAGKAIAENISGFDNIRKWAIWAAYSMEDYRNIVFLMLPHPHIMDYRYTVAWNRSQNKYYLPGAKDLETYNEMLSTEEFNLFWDFQILEYSWMIASLKNPSSNIRFISSIKEILVEAVFGNRIFYDFSKIGEVTEDIVKLPSVVRSWQEEGPFDSTKLRAMVPGVDTVSVRFFMVKENNIVNVTVTITGQKVIKYQEDKVGETIDWYGRGLK